LKGVPLPEPGAPDLAKPRSVVFPAVVVALASAGLYVVYREYKTPGFTKRLINSGMAVAKKPSMDTVRQEFENSAPAVAPVEMASAPVDGPIPEEVIVASAAAAIAAAETVAAAAIASSGDSGDIPPASDIASEQLPQGDAPSEPVAVEHTPVLTCEDVLAETQRVRPLLRFFIRIFVFAQHPADCRFWRPSPLSFRS
jgi:hypothetical protein